MAAAQAGALTGVRVEAAVVDIFTSIKPSPKPSPLLPRPREKETVWKVQRQVIPGLTALGRLLTPV
jgi:hypothetical protein